MAPYTIVWFNYQRSRRRGRKWKVENVLPCAYSLDGPCDLPNRKRLVGPFAFWVFELCTPPTLRTVVPTRWAENIYKGDTLSPFELLFGRKPL